MHWIDKDIVLCRAPCPQHNIFLKKIMCCGRKNKVADTCHHTKCKTQPLEYQERLSIVHKIGIVLHFATSIWCARCRTKYEQTIRLILKSYH